MIKSFIIALILLVPTTQARTINVAIVDSGVDITHSEFSDIPFTSWSFNGNNTDNLGHGTHIMGLIAKETHEMRVKVYKVTDTKPGRLSHVIKALNDIAIQKPDIVNISLGFTTDTPELKAVVTKILKNGTIIVAAAGNHSTTDKYYPAAYPGVISIGAKYSNGERLLTSNYGDWITYFGLGYRLYSTLPNNQYGYKSGTSQAAARITGKIVFALSKKH